MLFLRFRRNTCVVYTQTTMFGPLLFEQLALTPDPYMPLVMSNSGGWDVLSVERLSTLQAEHIFMVVDRDSEWYLRRVEDTPIWRQLPAVRHGHVYRVQSSTWLGGDGVLGCQAIVSDVLAAMIPGGEIECPAMTFTGVRLVAKSKLPLLAIAAIVLLLIGIAVLLFVGDVPIPAREVPGRAVSLRRAKLAAGHRSRLAFSTSIGRRVGGRSPSCGRRHYASDHAQSARCSRNLGTEYRRQFRHGVGNCHFSHGRTTGNDVSVDRRCHARRPR